MTGICTVIMDNFVISSGNAGSNINGYFNEISCISIGLKYIVIYVHPLDSRFFSPFCFFDFFYPSTLLLLSLFYNVSFICYFLKIVLWCVPIAVDDYDFISSQLFITFTG